MTKGDFSVKTYMPGHTEPEKGRLLIQAQLYDSYTKAYLQNAGIQAGMTVLDVGSGIGNLSRLAAKLVGRSGQIVGIDANAKVNRLAAQRLDELGHENVTFLTGDVLSFDFGQNFDAIIGRLILPHFKDPVALLERLGSYLCPGGIVAFEEIASLGVAMPACSQIDAVNELYARFSKHLGFDLAFGYKFPQIYQAAGLGTPALAYFAPAGTGPDWVGYKWLAEGIRTLMPTLQQIDQDSPETSVDIDTLENRIREEAMKNQSAVTLFPHIAAWTTAP